MPSSSSPWLAWGIELQQKWRACHRLASKYACGRKYAGLCINVKQVASTTTGVAHSCCHDTRPDICSCPHQHDMRAVCLHTLLQCVIQHGDDTHLMLQRRSSSSTPPPTSCVCTAVATLSLMLALSVHSTAVHLNLAL
jgi:hypothetical protein